jgi:hypothetical protein
VDLRNVPGGQEHWCLGCLGALLGEMTNGSENKTCARACIVAATTSAETARDTTMVSNKSRRGDGPRVVIILHLFVVLLFAPIGVVSPYAARTASLVC